MYATTFRLRRSRGFLECRTRDHLLLLFHYILLFAKYLTFTFYFHFSLYFYLVHLFYVHFTFHSFLSCDVDLLLLLCIIPFEFILFTFTFYYLIFILNIMSCKGGGVVISQIIFEYSVPTPFVPNHVVFSNPTTFVPK